MTWSGGEDTEFRLDGRCKMLMILKTKKKKTKKKPRGKKCRVTTNTVIQKEMSGSDTMNQVPYFLR